MSFLATASPTCRRLVAAVADPCSLLFCDFDCGPFFRRVTGAQVLTSIGQSFQTINDKDQWFDLSMLLLAIAVALKIYHMTIFFVHCQASEAPRTSINAPTGTSPGCAALPVTRDIEVFTTESERT